MIVKLTAPKGVTAVGYGAIEMQIAGDGALDVPRYVAKAIKAADARFSCAEDLSAVDVAADLGAGEPWETNYLHQAHGAHLRSIPLDTRVAAAKDLLARRGEPKVAVFQS
jgi:hypothetical protein